MSESLAPSKAIAEDELVTTTSEEQISVATQWQLMWWRFRKHTLAMIAAAFIIIFYLVVIAADFLSYADPSASEAQRGLLSPSQFTGSMRAGSAPMSMP